jgi:predicted dehydrogenase
MENSNITRRRFVGASLAGVALGGIEEAAKPVTVGLIGGGIRGLELMQNALEVGAKVAIVCDLYDGHLRRANEIQPNMPTTRNYEDVLARKDLDAVMIATSDHWHAPIAIAAMRAGKDVYCEKPMAHTIPQALDMARVSKETGRLVQVGSQSLSMTSTAKGKQWLESGAIGKVYMVQCEIFRPNAIGAWRYPVPPDASPQTVDWDRYQANLPNKRPFDAARFFQFRNWWEYGTGIAGDEYVHLLSRVHYLMGVRYPVSAVSYGGIYQWTGDRDVPDIHNTLYDYGKFQVTVSANLVTNWEGGEIVRFMGDKGTIELTEVSARLLPYTPVEEYAYPLEAWPKDLKETFMAGHKDDPVADIGTAKQQPQRPVENFKQEAEGTTDHMRNLFAAMASRQQPVENVEFGCGTAVACHMANLSYREKRRVIWDAARLELGRG